MSLTLADVDGLLYTALSGLLINVTTGTTEARPFATVGRYAGSLDETSVRAGRHAVPCRVARLRRRDGHAHGQHARGRCRDRGLNAWTVYVCVEDARAIDDGTVGSAAAPGGLRLVDAVLGCSTGS